MSKDQIVGIDWNRIARLHSHVLAHELTNSIALSHKGITEGRGIWDSDFSESTFLLEFTYYTVVVFVL